MILESLENIEVEINRVRSILSNKSRVVDDRDSQGLTFREFAQSFKGDKRISHTPFFHSVLDKAVNPLGNDFAVGFKTYGDIPLRLLIKQTDHRLSRISGVSVRGVQLFRTLVEERGLQ